MTNSSSVINQVLPLRDIALPEQPSIWPLTFAWWAVIFMCLLMCIGLGVLISRFMKHRMNLAAQKRLKQKRAKILEQILAEMDANFTAFMEEKHPKNSHCFAEQLSLILRRSALHFFEDKAAANLQGDHWSHYLQKQSKLDAEEIDELTDVLGKAIYNPRAEITKRQAKKFCQLSKQIIIAIEEQKWSTQQNSEVSSVLIKSEAA